MPFYMNTRPVTINCKRCKVQVTSGDRGRKYCTPCSMVAHLEQSREYQRKRREARREARHGVG